MHGRITGRVSQDVQRGEDHGQADDIGPAPRNQHESRADPDSDPLTGAQINNSLDISPNFFVVDVGISRTWVLGDHTDLTASLAIKNLFNGFQGDLDNGPYRDPAYVMGPRFPRTYFAGLTLEF